MTDPSKPERQTSDGLDLTARREEFLETFFRKGAEFTSELLDEVQALRDRIDALEDENVALRHQLASDDAIRDLLVKIEDLEKEKHSLRGRAHDATQESLDYKSKYSEVEAELSAMANLYVAAYQLHATLETQEVLSVIEQLLMQFVGAGSFAIFVIASRDNERVLEPVHAFECDVTDKRRVPMDRGVLGEVASTQVYFVRDPERPVEEGEPLACVPLVLAGTTVGVIAIYELLEQKTEFVEIDFELFKLLGLHSASAIVGAGLLSGASGVAAGLDGYPRL